MSRRTFSMMNRRGTLTLAAALAASPIKLSGRLEYQACDDKVCYAPTKVPVSFALTVK